MGIFWVLSICISAFVIWNGGSFWPLVICASLASIHVLMELPSRRGTGIAAFQYAFIRGIFGLVFVAIGTHFLYGAVQELVGAEYFGVGKPSAGGYLFFGIIHSLRALGGGYAVAMIASIAGAALMGFDLRIWFIGSQLLSERKIWIYSPSSHHLTVCSGVTRDRSGRAHRNTDVMQRIKAGVESRLLTNSNGDES